MALKSLEEKFDSNQWLWRSAPSHPFNCLTDVEPTKLKEVSIEDFNNFAGVNIDEVKKISKKNQYIANNYVRFTIIGKMNRTVPVLLTSEHKNALKFF